MAEHDAVDIAALLARLPLFSAITPAHIQHLAAASREKRLARGETLFHRGDIPRGFYAVVYGQVKLAFSSPQGTEKVVEIIGPRQTFGEAVMFMQKAYPVFAEALADTLVVHIPRKAVVELLDSDSTFALHMLAGLSMRVHQLIQDVESYSLRSGAQRLIGYLIRNCEEPETGAGNTLDLELPTSKQVIASLLNLTPETFSRVLHDLSASGLITVHGRRITINDIERLRHYEP
ncbi:MAG: Crp/Fnr family transcriptional regulator [Rhodocyclaceae bacterium]